MGARTGIEWCDATLNFWFGCTKISPACARCYAEAWAKRSGMVGWGPHAERRRAVNTLAKARKIERLYKAEGRRPFVFCNSLSDIFDLKVPIAWLHEAFDTMRATPWNIYLLLTKRPGNITERAAAAGGLPPNCAIGCTVINQEEADRDIPKLLLAAIATGALFAFLSIEPMLGPIDLAWAISSNPLDIAAGFLKRSHFSPGLETLRRIAWVIVGGESGGGARPLHPDWVRDLLFQCLAALTPFLFKQWGEWTPGENVKRQTGTVETATWFDSRWDFDKESLANTDGHIDDEPDLYRVGKKAAGRRLDGVEHNGMPELAA